MTSIAFTDHPSLDAALAPLARLEEVPIERHAELFDAVHTAMRQALTGDADADAVRP